MGQKRVRKQINLTVRPETHYILAQFKQNNRSQFVDEIVSFWLCNQNFTVNNEHGVSITVSLKQFGPLFMWETDYGDIVSPEFRSEIVALKWIEDTYKTELK